MSFECSPSLQLCAVRVTLLDSLGNVADVEDNSYVSAFPVNIQANPDILAGTVENLVGGCDCLIAWYKGDDKLLRFGFQAAMGAMEPALLSLLLGTDPVLDGSDVIGVTWPGAQQCGDQSPPNLAWEFWTKKFIGDYQDPTWPWFHHVYPSSTWMIAQQQYQNGFAPQNLSGFTRQNPLWGNGPYGDQPIGYDFSAGGWFATVDDPPTAECGFQHVAPGS